MTAAIVKAEPIIGMEIHVELATRSKMFAAAPNPACEEFDGSGPNTLTDALVLALPGSLPVMNREAVELSMLVGMALGCRIAEVSRWDRKSYVYPDLPKGYQISQYDRPLCEDGVIETPGLDEQGFFVLGGPTTRVRIVRAHLEEDAGKLLHEAPGGGAIAGSIVDLNRAGTPLLEIVTAPDMTSAEQAVSVARLLRLTCLHLGVTRGVMQKGHMRFEPNINMRLRLDDGREVVTPIVEIKNLNSFRALGGAIEYELRVQPERWRSTGEVMGPGAKATRGWDDARGETTPQREKEDAHDYRYFPDPDLPLVRVDEAWRQSVRGGLTEAPMERMRRYADGLGLPSRDAQTLVEDPALTRLFESCLGESPAAGLPVQDAARQVSVLLLQVGARLGNERGVGVAGLGVEAGTVAQIAAMRAGGQISAASAALLFERASAGPIDVEHVARDEGMILERDEGALRAWCEQVIARNPEIAGQIRQGRQQAVGRLIGEVMTLSERRADANSARQMLLSLLGE